MLIFNERGFYKLKNRVVPAYANVGNSQLYENQFIARNVFTACG